MMTLHSYMLARYPDDPEAVEYTMRRRGPREIIARERRGSSLIDCQCQCECGEYATTSDDTSVDVCDECAQYAVDEDGEVVCSRDERYRDDGEWTGGGMYGCGTGWVSRPRVVSR